VGKYSTEYIVSSDDLLLGFRGLWNFGIDPQIADAPETAPSMSLESEESPPINGRLSAGLEMYYGLLNKGGGCTTILLAPNGSVDWSAFYNSSWTTESPDHDPHCYTINGSNLNFLCH